MNVLTFSTLFPNAEQPTHGLFVEHRLRHLRRACAMAAMVVAPVPWFPSRNPRFGRYATFAGVPAREIRDGLTVLHPRYPVIPKVGMALAPALMAAALFKPLRDLHRSAFRFDLIDAHFLYPDGVAAVMLGRRLGVPVVMTARGTDVHTYRHEYWPRRMIVRAAMQAARVITVAEALREALLELDVAPESVVTLRNGVDLDLFRPKARDAARRQLGIEGPTLLSVGALRPVKGHDLTIQALPRMPGVRLVLVGDGAERQALEALAAATGVRDRVRFEGAVPQTSLVDYYSAADALVLPSEREGWPNVLLESMACGTPVVASPAWGIPEVITAPAAGRLMRSRTPEDLAAAANALLETPPTPAETRAYAEGFDWSDTSRRLAALFEEVLEVGPGPDRGGSATPSEAIR